MMVMVMSDGYDGDDGTDGDDGDIIPMYML